MGDAPAGDLKCPRCDLVGTHVIDTRGTQRGYIRRRRECTRCGFRFSTREVLMHEARLPIEIDSRLAELQHAVERLREDLKTLPTDSVPADRTTADVASRPLQ